MKCTYYFIKRVVFNQGIRIKLGKGNGAGLARESQSHCFAVGFLITDEHSFGTDTHT